MNIFLTLDYELYFGTTTGSAEKCILQPTRELMDISARTGTPMTYFIDVGYLIKLEAFKQTFPELKPDYDAITEQIRRLVETGNDCQLHIHPHWEDSYYDKHGWHIDATRYKLTDFDTDSIVPLVLRYQSALEAITGKPVNCYRAGGWCLQPFDRIAPAFDACDIRLDSTVFPGGFNDTPPYFYDFRTCPDKTLYKFSASLTKAEENGKFYELPISAYTYTPAFFWRLFALGRLNPGQHKPIGDGKPIAGGGSKREMLTRTNRMPVSLDGYFVTRLQTAMKQVSGNHFVVIGHPKACTPFSLRRLEKFIQKNCRKHTFKTVSEILSE